MANAKLSTSKVTSKGQVTVPEDVRNALGLSQGDRLEWEATRGGKVEVRKALGKVADLVGILGKPRQSRTIEDLDEALRSRFRARHAHR